jgi:tripartite-type tricarboxylate transporter receptor subunit TctC
MNRRDALALLGAALMPRLALAQAQYPQRPIKLLVPFSPGGVTDIVGRQWAERMKGPLGSVFIENQGGGGGVIGAVDVARSVPDGHTLILGNTSIMVLNPMTMSKLPYDPVKDFIQIAILCVAATAMVVNAALPVKNLKELIAYAKANPGKLSYGSAGTGTMTNLAGEMFKQLTGTADIVHIPYKGAGPGISDLVAGHIPLMTPNITGQILEFHKAGKVRILAVNAPERLTAAPDIPTAIEEGLPGMIGMLFVGIAAPAATPRPIVDKIAAASRTTMADPDFQKVLLAAGLEAIPNSNPEHARKFLQEEHDRWLPVIKATGLKID